MQPAPESCRGTTEQPVSIGRLPGIDFRTAEFHADSINILSAACNSGPLCRQLPQNVAGLLRFRDVDAVLRDPLTFSSRTNLFTPPADMATLGTLIGEDPPNHTRLRGLFGQIFTRRACRRRWSLGCSRSRVSSCKGSSIAAPSSIWSATSPFPFPSRAIAELLGVDASLMDQFKQWSDQVVEGLQFPFMPDGPEKDSVMAMLFQTLRELDAYLTQSIDDARKDPRDNLLSFMVHASEGVRQS